MENKKIILYDKGITKDDEAKIIRGAATIINPATGKVIFNQKPNKIIIHGSSYTAKKHFPDLPIPGSTITYNEALGLDHTKVINDINKERIILFSVGTDGCGVDAHQVKHVDYASWCPPESLVPFRYLNNANDNVDRNTYFGKKTNNVTGMTAYYFKRFDSDPQWEQRYVSDGAPVEANVYNSTRKDEIESFVEIKMKVSVDDCVEFFEQTTGLNYAKLNTISLLTAVADDVGGSVVYQDIRPITKINFSNQSLSELNKGLDIIYHIYY